MAFEWQSSTVSYELHKNAFIFIFFLPISFNILLCFETKKTLKNSCFGTIHYFIYFQHDCLLTENFSLFLWELLPTFAHCLGFLLSVFNPTIFGFSVKVTYAACSISNKLMPLIRIYMYLILLTHWPIFVWNPAC